MISKACPCLFVLTMALVIGCTKERSLTVTATAFNSTRAQTDGRPNETACGKKIKPGEKIVAVSRDLMEAGLICGTEIRIQDVEGSWVVADKTAARHEKHIDIYMGRDVRAAREWGVKEVEIAWRE